mmetsp:Transcript_12103/g.34020  ORF Transcript_12103/g.34020 Transcript_12103/m.34020 type:complete len:322 (-) Transcript_12103:80-1045(-)|eukprot:CAMPEP_0117683544 /NCGR_PEP_ID=MMETSP0804-20121206/20471_1 /TAXON_ID=1074897 /ORGANISM="Tetraselmis astigmatica, Strain CCMP880" /LENGTH=321 /DNA_ID=CAMNT_0005494173 /DNA_START=154 /DNA_END=1119 /DNA_ORIENTATION=-
MAASSLMTFAKSLAGRSPRSSGAGFGKSRQLSRVVSTKTCAKMNLDQEGKLVLITGSTDGIGLLTAQKLAAQGASVILHGRSHQRLKDAIQTVEKAHKGTGKVFAYERDLSDLHQVRLLAGDVREHHSSIDVLVNNAGVYMEDMQLSKDGFEMTYAVNVLAPFLLTSLIHDIVTARIVNTASISAASRLDLNNLNQEKGFSSHNAYSLSKLLNIIFTFELAKRMKDRPFTVNTLDPGTVNTKMLLAGWGRIGISIEQATNEHFMCTSPDLHGVSGQYFVGNRQSRAPPPAYDEELRQTLWDLWLEQTDAHESFQSLSQMRN